jgi:hypothetical protein
MDKDDLADVKKALSPWWPGKTVHRRLVIGLMGLGLVPLIRPDLHVEFPFAAWAVLPLMSPRVRSMIAGRFRRS